MEIGCCAPIEKYQEVSDAGFDYIELPGFQLAAYDYTLFKQFVQITNMVYLPVTRINSYCAEEPKIIGDGFNPDAVKRYAHSLIDRAGILNLNLILDLYNMRRSGEDWADIKKYVPYIRHMHISTDLGGLDRGVYSEADREELTETVKAIKDSGYEGTVSMEPVPSRVNRADLTAALKMMREIAK